MAKVERREIIQRVIEGLRLDVGREVTPQEVEDKIRAVFVANEENIALIMRDSQSATTGKATVFVTPLNKDFFLTAVQFGYTCDVVADSTAYEVEIQPFGDTTFRDITLQKTTLTARTDHQVITFSPPLKIERGTVLGFRQTFTVGASVMTGTFVGYEKEL